MSTFWILRSISNKVDKGFMRFWRGFAPNKVHNFIPKSWSSICKPKSAGGLGIRTACGWHYVFWPTKGCVGIILRDTQGGHIKMAASMLGNDVPNPETIEALSIFRGLQLCICIAGYLKTHPWKWLFIYGQRLTANGRFFSPLGNLDGNKKTYGRFSGV